MTWPLRAIFQHERLAPNVVSVLTYIEFLRP